MAERKKHLLNLVTVLLLTMTFIFTGITSAIVDVPSYALSMGTEIHKGDTLTLEAGSWKKDYLVLDPENTNTGEEGAFLLQKHFYSGQEIRFDVNGESNVWEGSSAQDYCTEYYRSMPESLRNSVIGVKTAETGNAGSNNIDGTRSGENADKDKVFAMSFAEFYSFRDHIYKNDNIPKSFKWWLRSPDTSGSNMVKIVDGDRNTAAVESNKYYVLRPAFNISLPDDFCASAEELSDGTADWTVNLDNPGHTYGDPTYTWSGGGEKCTAQTSCGKCGKTIKESAYSTSDLAADGSEVFTATFENELFETQQKTVKADALGGKIQKGDVLRFKTGSNSLDFIVLDPSKNSVGNDGMFLLLKESTEKTEYDESEQSNQWEGSTAQAWCTEFYRNLPPLVKNSVVGVRTRDTESGQDWLGVNNIDGTKSDKDKVFFLSYKEYVRYKDVSNVVAPYKWLLRNYGVDCASDIHAYVGVIQENGEPKDYGIHSALAARPAFNISLADDVKAARSTVGGVTVWIVDTENPTAEPSNDSQAAGKDTAKTQPAVTEIVDLPAVKIIKPKAGKRSMTVRWKKPSRKNRKKIKGIEIRYTGPGINKIVTAGGKKTSKTIKRLKPKKTYKVQVRAVANINGVKHVSKWSKARKVKIR